MTFESPVFSKEEILRHSQGFPKVLATPSGMSTNAFLDRVKENQTELREQLANHGALLFRKCGVKTTENFHQLLQCLQIEACDPNHYYGEVMRAATGDNVMEPTLVPPDLVIAPHNESAFWYKQPEYISFFCQETNALGGQTPIIDCAKVAADFSPELRGKLLQSSAVNEYVFDDLHSNKTLVKGQKRNTWQVAFQTSEREAVEAIAAQRNDVELLWRKGGALHVKIKSGVFANHPTTGELCFRAMRAFDFANVKYMLEEFAKDQMPYHKYLSSKSIIGLSSWLTGNNLIEHQKYSWKTTIENGPELTPAESACVTETLFKHATIFRWHPEDVLVIDNVKAAHGRLNVDAKRVIHVFMSKYIDQKTFMVPAAEATP